MSGAPASTGCGCAGLVASPDRANAPPGLNLLYGPNEAGKSTLLAFLRRMLFGFEKQGPPSVRYEPEAGGTVCGELVAEHRRGAAAGAARGGPAPQGGSVLRRSEGEPLPP